MKISERLATLTAEEIAAGRSWLAELAWRDATEEDIMDAELTSDLQVVRAVAQNFDGGWPMFLETMQPVEAVVYSAAYEADAEGGL